MWHINAKSARHGYEGDAGSAGGFILIYWRDGQTRFIKKDQGRIPGLFRF
jgi:hypothetical protein